VLVSGGLDSAVLLVEEAVRGPVQPLYIRAGLAWEAAEREMLARFLAHESLRDIRPLVSLRVDMTDVFPARHWAIEGTPPAYHTADEDVYLPGRNIVLLGKAAVYCAIADIPRLVLGTLEGNPFPDATDAFRDAMSEAVSLGLDHRLAIDAPLARAEKSAVIQRGMTRGVPLTLTLSCMRPAPGPLHCGLCSKCRERHDAFKAAHVPDTTIYADRRYVDSGVSF
jgi:7-cyano-7-deazaguanine synthase